MTRKVLIVDDSKLARMSVLKVLRTLHPDYVCIEVGYAGETLDVVRREAPDFVLLDFNMPGKDGLTLAAELRELNPSIAVAVISANHQKEVVERARATGAVFIRKPLTAESLTSFLSGVAGQDKLAQ